MDWVVIAAFLASVYYAMDIFGKAKQYDWAALAEKAASTSNIYKRYVYWGVMQRFPGANPIDYYALNIAAGCMSAYMTYCFVFALDNNDYGWWFDWVMLTARTASSAFAGWFFGGAIFLAYHRLMLSTQHPENFQEEDNLHHMPEGGAEIGDKPEQ